MCAKLITALTTGQAQGYLTFRKRHGLVKEKKKSHIYHSYLPLTLHIYSFNYTFHYFQIFSLRVLLIYLEKVATLYINILLTGII